MRAARNSFIDVTRRRLVGCAIVQSKERGTPAMIIGTVRSQEARVYDNHAGYHQFHAEPDNSHATPERHGSFEVFWHDGGHMVEHDGDGDMSLDDWRDAERAGWYWWACFPGCLPDGELCGPFASSAQAHEDADEWNPDYDPE
jgi:hypothetical protein